MYPNNWKQSYIRNLEIETMERCYNSFETEIFKIVWTSGSVMEVEYCVNSIDLKIN